MQKLKFIFLLIIVYVVFAELINYYQINNPPNFIYDKYSYFELGVNRVNLIYNNSDYLHEVQLEKNLRLLRKNIYANVVDYDANQSYMIVLQEPNFHEHYSMLSFALSGIFLEEKKKFLYSDETSAFLADSILENSSHYKKIFS